MTDMTIGYDMDGVLADIPSGLPFGGVRTQIYEDAKPLKPAKLKGLWALVITGRREKYRNITADWLNEHIDKGYNELIMMPDGEPTTDKMVFAKFKADAIKKEGVDIYIDDDRDIVDLLQEMCPDTVIVHYKEPKP